MRRSIYLPLMLLSLFGLFIGGNALIGQLFPGARLDLTQSGLYRLSPGSEAVIARLDEPVEWDFYYSRRVAAEYPAVRSYASRVREFLRAYEQRAGGRIRLTEIDPLPFSEDEDAALAAGLVAAPTEAGEQILFGLVARNSVDQQAVIPFFDEAQEARLEYDLTRSIAVIERAVQPSIAVLTSLEITPDSGAPNRLTAELAAAYDVTWLDHEFDTIPDVAALVILHPGSLSQAQYYLIDQYVMRHGRVVAMIDPLAHMALRVGPDGLPPLNASRESSLGPLLGHWGVNWDVNTVAMDRALGLPVEIREADGRSRRRAYPLWFSTGPEFMSDIDLATATLDRSINFGSPGALVFNEEGPLAVTALIETSPEGALLDADIAASAPGPDDLLRDYVVNPVPITLAARLSGVLETAFPEGPPADALVLNPGAHLDAASGLVDIALVADADWLDDSYYVRAEPALGETLVADNLALVLNLIDQAAGDPALVSLRSRPASYRPMTRVDALRAEAETRYFEIQDELEAEIADAETRLASLVESGSASGLYATDPVAQAEARALRQEITQTRASLREVEREFRRDIDQLEADLQFWTIGVPPALVILAAIAGMVVRRRRRAL